MCLWGYPRRRLLPAFRAYSNMEVRSSSAAHFVVFFKVTGGRPRGAFSSPSPDQVMAEHGRTPLFTADVSLAPIPKPAVSLAPRVLVTDTANQLLEQFRAGDRRALARILSRIEDGDWEAQPPQPTSPPMVVGITGSGGAGKSTLVGALVNHLRAEGVNVAVLACDPQSPRSGGSLLGDRIRVAMDPDDEGVFFRSLSTRGATGGIAPWTRDATAWLGAFGFDVVLLETVGVGQDQFAIRDFVDVLVLVVTPMSGDEVQWEKAGLIELVDIIAVNKSDQPGADRVRQQLHIALSLSDDRADVPILPTVASSGSGVPELWQEIAELRRRQAS